MSCPYISVLTVADEHPASVLSMARALSRQTLPPDRFEWVACLNGADDHAREAFQALDVPFAVRPFEADLVRSTGAARNACASRTCGSILLLPDADWLPAAESLAAHVAVQEAGLCLAVARPRRPLRALVSAAAGRGSRTGAWSVPGSVYRAVGGFDASEGDPDHAERRLHRRLRRAGLPLRALDDRAVPGRRAGGRASEYVNTEDAR